MSGARILLVEDDNVLRTLILRNLQKRGHDVSVAEDAHAALASLRTTPFDLILLDINLPDETGWEVLRMAQKEGILPSLKTREASGHLPVIVLSAVRVSPVRLTEFGPVAYLPKPFPLDALLQLAAEAAPRKAGSTATREEGTLSTEDEREKEELHA